MNHAEQSPQLTSLFSDLAHELWTISNYSVEVCKLYSLIYSNRQFVKHLSVNDFSASGLVYNFLLQCTSLDQCFYVLTQALCTLCTFRHCITFACHYDLDLLHYSTCYITGHVTGDWTCKQIWCITVCIMTTSCPELTHRECYLLSKTASRAFNSLGLSCFPATYEKWHRLSPVRQRDKMSMAEPLSTQDQFN